MPFWSVALTRANGTDLSEDSIFGLTEFRKLFGMKNLEKVLIKAARIYGNNFTARGH